MMTRQDTTAVHTLVLALLGVSLKTNAILALSCERNVSWQQFRQKMPVALDLATPRSQAGVNGTWIGFMRAQERMGSIYTTDQLAQTRKMSCTESFAKNQEKEL